MSKVELLAPAGNRECLETAFHFGADAAYVAGKGFGLRAFAANFDEQELASAVAYAHGLGKKIYLTVNSLVFNEELNDLEKYLAFLDTLNIGGIIFSDPAVLYLSKKLGLKTPLHLSTQASTVNYCSAAYWYEEGVKRIVLSREMTLKDIKLLRENTPPELEIEAFVHGSMCVAHSGRCLLSGALTGRSGNRGECAQPCRWRFHLSEQGYPGEFFPIDEDEKGTYILNSRDLMVIEHIPEMIGAGISSFKIEGRMKSAYYVASVVSAYRRAIDSYYSRGADYCFDPALKEELVKSAARGFCTGFFFGNPLDEGQDIARDEELRKYTFVAKALSKSEDGFVWLEQRNKFSLGEMLEVLSPGSVGMRFKVTEILNEDGEAQEAAPHAQQKIKIACPCDLQPGDILRRHD